MGLKKDEFIKIVNFVKKEPCLIQDISKLLNKSWMTCQKYVEQISREKGLIKIKAFRKGTRGAVKIVYWNYSESTQLDEIKIKLFEKIKIKENKKSFDPLEIFQYVNQKGAKAFLEYYDDPSISTKQKIYQMLSKTKEELLIFSGNLSLINMVEDGKKMYDLIEKLVKRGVIIKILCRVDIASIKNLNTIEKLIKKYPNNIEIRHYFHPLRGFVIDNNFVRLKDEKSKSDFKKNELKKDVRLFYEFKDSEWVNWLENVFWALFKNSIDYKKRLIILNKILIE